jgi:hypothetical protein
MTLEKWCHLWFRSNERVTPGRAVAADFSLGRAGAAAPGLFFSPHSPPPLPHGAKWPGGVIIKSPLEIESTAFRYCLAAFLFLCPQNHSQSLPTTAPIFGGPDGRCSSLPLAPVSLVHVWYFNPTTVAKAQAGLQNLSWLLQVFQFLPRNLICSTTKLDSLVWGASGPN